MIKVPPEHFKPYVPNPNTKLGRAYVYAVKDCDGTLLAAEANYLRDNPLLWLRSISLYAANLDFLIRQSNTRLKARAPKSGEPHTPEYIKECRQAKNWSLVQEHRLHKIKARRAELVVELGYRDIRDVLILGDLVGMLTDILAAFKQDDAIEARRLSEYWLTRLTGLNDQRDDDEGEPDLPSATSMLLRLIRGEGS
jgi:hypothetical protein